MHEQQPSQRGPPSYRLLLPSAMEVVYARLIPCRRYYYERGYYGAMTARRKPELTSSVISTSPLFAVVRWRPARQRCRRPPLLPPLRLEPPMYESPRLQSEPVGNDLAYSCRSHEDGASAQGRLLCTVSSIAFNRRAWLPQACLRES